MRRSAWVLGVLAAAALAAAAGDTRFRPPVEVIRPPDALGALQSRYDWAVGDARKREPGQSLWIGYSVMKLMGENQMIGSFRHGAGDRSLGIRDILSGQAGAPDAQGTGDIRDAARAALGHLERPGQPGRKVPREIAVLFCLGTGESGGLEEVELSQIDLAFDFRGLPLIWLGGSGDGESLDLIGRLFVKGASAETKEGLVAAAGVHGTPALVVPFLEGILTGRESDELRANAAFWISQQNDPSGLRILLRRAKEDPSEEVREGAVFAISQVDLPEGPDELITLARSAKRTDVRKQAVFWLGQLASEKAVRALVEFAGKDPDIEIQEQAVFALSQLPASAGVEPLIRIAKTHPDPRVRKKAIFWLGECEDPRAIEALVEILKGK